jgi:uncharacterized RmlC-like cupin family protein
MSDADRGSCVVVHPDESRETLQGLANFAGISSESAGSQGVCLHVITFAPGTRARPHLHEGHETALYMLSGEVGMWYGSELEQYLEVRAGDFLYIPANMPHQPFNLSKTEGASALGARTDPNEQESVVLLPHLEAVHAE